MTTTKLLEIGAVHKSYGAVTVLGGINLGVAAGSRTAIVGPSGSGKTTLLRIIAGFEVPDAGTVTLGDKRMANGPDAVPAHQRGIGFVPQDGALFPHLNVADNVGFGLPRSMPGRTERIAELMDMVSLDTAMLTRRPHELSGGQQQRVALARALAQRPRLMLLDEPFSALDTGLRAATRKAVAQLLTTAGITTILVTHDQSEALSFADQVAVMRSGKLVQVGAPIEVYLRPHDPVTASFLGDCIVLPAQITLQQGAPWADCVLGRIPVGADTPTRGAAQIMLRPEQLQVEAVPAAQALAGNSAEGACYGEVVQADFGGAVCTLSVRLLGEAASTPVLDMQCPGIHAPAAGATVRITVSGAGHVFSQDAGS